MTGHITEPCQPYELGPGRAEVVDVYAVIDRLTAAEQRSMLMAFSVHDPAWFEDKLARIWSERPSPGCRDTRVATG